MPERANGYTPMETLSVEERLSIDKKWQAHWYRHVAQFLLGKTVLDAGAGTGYGMSILKLRGAAVVEGFDLVKLAPDVVVSRIEDYADESWDYVLCVDVLEHVQDDRGFMTELLRVARSGVFFTTPNWNVFKAKNRFHAREYTPVELEAFVGSFGFTKPWKDHRIWVSNHVLEITTREHYDPKETWHNWAIMLDKKLRVG